MPYRILKILVAFFFLTVLVPGNKLALPAGLMLIIPLTGIGAFSDLLFVILPIAGVVYLIISGIKSLNTKRDKILTIISIIIFWGFLLYFTRSFAKYSDKTIVISLVVFILPSLFCLIIVARSLWKNSASARSSEKP